MHISGEKSPLTQHKPSWVYVSIGYVSVKKSFSYLLTSPWRPSREPKQQQQICHPLLCRNLLDQCPALLAFTLGFIWEGASPAATAAQHKGSVHLGLLTCECCIRNPNLCEVHSEALQNSLIYFCCCGFQIISLNDDYYPSLSACTSSWNASFNQQSWACWVPWVGNQDSITMHAPETKLRDLFPLSECRISVQLLCIEFKCLMQKLSPNITTGTFHPNLMDCILIWL